MDIQHRKDHDYYDRFLHYHCMALLEQVKNSENYKPALAVYTIVVLTSGDKYKQPVSVIDFNPKRLDGRTLNEFKHKVIYLCPKYLNENTPLLYQEWLKVINESLDKQVDESKYQLAEIQTALLRIEEDGITPDERAKMIEESYAQKAEQRGIEQGMTEGKQAKALEIAQGMLAEGFDIKTIIKITGLTQELILQ